MPWPIRFGPPPIIMAVGRSVTSDSSSLAEGL
jgi:hypothetical protein